MEQGKVGQVSGLDGWRRSHNLGELRASDVGKEVTLMGWVQRRRDLGQLVFIDLRDRFGITQVVLDPSDNPAIHALGGDIKFEYVLGIKGKVAPRPEGMVNASMPTGAVEVKTSQLKIFSKSAELPFQIRDDVDVSESIRLKYRYLDLRRDGARQKILERIKFVQCVRRSLEIEGFLDFETPILCRSTPEGARDYLVPSRVHEGKFYALPQSPQLFKQLLMVSGFDRYYQIAKCFRDEDLRADRQPEFTQIDCEMSFVDEFFIRETFERIMTRAIKEFNGREIPIPFQKMTYKEALDQYGVDKPDTRFDMKITDISDLVKGCGFKVFSEAVAGGGIVNVINVKGKAESFSRKDVDQLTDLAKKYGANGLASVKKVAGNGQASWQSSIAKFFNDDVIATIDKKVDCKEGDLLLFGAGVNSTTKASLGAVRVFLGNKLNLCDPNKLNFLWVTDFPMFEKDSETGRLVACHHPFTMPHPEDQHLLESEPLKVRASAYDMVLNGFEISSGSIRIHDPVLQQKIFDCIGIKKEEAESRFGFLLEAFRYGPPPHGGLAFGLDRIIMILTNTLGIKDVIPFPKTQTAADLMTDAPNSVSDEQLKDLHIKLNLKPTHL